MPVQAPQKPLRSLLGVCFLHTACAQPQSSPPATTVTSASAPASFGASATSRELGATGEAHALVIRAASCWLGGLWSDALGESEEARYVGIQRRCEALLHVVGESPVVAYYPLRALDPTTIDRLALQVWRTAVEDAYDRPHAAELVAFFRAVADASHETVHARRAADKVKEAYESASADERRDFKIAAAPELLRTKGLHALLADRGPYAEEARVIGTLYALDRMEIARGLPKHLKIHAVEGAYLEVFGVAAPPLSSDAAAPLPAGSATWLGYLSAVAFAAGHPVPGEAKDPQNREPLAWSGVLLGFADKLRRVRTDPSLDAVAHSIVARLDEQAARTRAAFEAHAPAER
jgi:hypothetical protein